MTPHVAILIGPTASGKSALAIEVACRRDTVIINADAMQMYRDLHVITARPSLAEMQQADHALYGHWAGHVHGTAALWVSEAVPAIRSAWDAGKLPLLVGGTGMYIRALMEGLSPIPPVPMPVVEEVRALEAKGGTEAVRAALVAADPVMAARLEPGDTQRNMRALEVVHGTGKSLAEWQSHPPVPPLPEAQFRVYAMRPEREALYAAIDVRFEAMMEAGALDEVRALMALALPAHLPVLKAHGVPELSAYLRGDMALDQAVAKAQQHTRNYAKRQMTWIRQQLPEAADGREILTIR